MGMLATGIGISTECYDTLAKWLGKIPGGLGVATTLGCTAFGTLNGSALVTGSVFAKIAAPEMKRYGYDQDLSYGLIAASGNIGQFIPLHPDRHLRRPVRRLHRPAAHGRHRPGPGPGDRLLLFTVITAIVKPKLFPRVDQTYTWKEKLISSRT